MSEDKQKGKERPRKSEQTEDITDMELLVLLSSMQKAYSPDDYKEKKHRIPADEELVEQLKQLGEQNRNGPDNPILALVAEHESGHNYNAVWGSLKDHTINGKLLSECTINEVLAWQEQGIREGRPSVAAGCYQFINKTLEGLCKRLKLSGNEKFDKNMQDRLAMHLLNRRGYQKFLDGKMSEKRFIKNLSKEWASLPSDIRNKSYYNDNLNKALTSYSTVRDAVKVAFVENKDQFSNPQLPGLEQNTLGAGFKFDWT